MRRNDAKFSRENRERIGRTLKQFGPIAARHGASVAQVVIALTARQRGISHVLIGARNARQAVENAKGGTLRLTEEECRELDGIVAANLR
jgi:aryl-alcohol dehydrogenase-like predicted oxidoreductase